MTERAASSVPDVLPADLLDREFTAEHQPHAAVEAAWVRIYAEPGPEIGLGDGEQPASEMGQVDHELERKLNMSLAELELSVRATNCLESEGITTVRDLVSRSDEELVEVRNFGETTLKEVKTKLSERGMHLGMKLPASLRR